MSFCTGNTFQHKDTEKYPNHLCVLICHTGNPPQECVVVNVTSIQGTCIDKSCLLRAGDHPFITRPSYVFYRKANISAISAIEEAEKCGVVWKDKDMTSAVLARIQQGALDSAMTPNEVKDFLRKNVSPF